MQESLGTLGYCPTCRESMITQSGVPICVNCVKPKRPAHIVKVPPVTEVPNDAEFSKMAKGHAAAVYTGPRGTIAGPIVGKTALDALNIMRQLAMPKDMKEFKQIQKIIKQLEKLVGENHAIHD